MQRVYNAAQMTAPKRYLKTRVTRKPGDGGWLKIPGGLEPPRVSVSVLSTLIILWDNTRDGLNVEVKCHAGA